MSNTKKTVRISENDLVNLIDNIVAEAVTVKKKEWLAEQTKVGNKTTILETRLAALEAKINGLAKKK